MMNSTKMYVGPYGGKPGEWCKIARESSANAWWFHGFNEECFEACDRVGLSPCVEHATFRADFAAHPELKPTGTDGNPIRYGNLVQGICLSNLDFIDEKKTSLIDGLKSYSPSGVWLDYLTYAGWFEMPDPDLQESCFCPACMARFCEEESVDATNPAEILQSFQAEWTRHKCLRIAQLGKEFADIVRQYDPNCPVGIYVCPWSPNEFDGALTRIFAQDMDLLSSFADIITPLIYCEKSGRSPWWGREYLEVSPTFIPASVRIQPILDMLDFPDSLVALSNTSKPLAGFQMFSGSEMFEDPDSAKIFSSVVDAISDSGS